MDSRMRNELDRHITGNYGEDQFRDARPEGDEDLDEDFDAEQSAPRHYPNAVVPIPSGFPTYATLDLFLDEGDGERRRSPECDYGVNWTHDGTRRPGSWPRYRVSYVKATGEVYAFQHQNDSVEVLGIVPPDPPSADDVGSKSGHIYYRTLDRILHGWEHEHDLTWVRERLRANRA